MKNEQNFQNVSAGVIGLSGVVMFSAKSVFAKMAYEYRVDPISVLFLRMLFALPLVVLIGFFYEKTRKPETVKWRDILKVAGISVLGYYISAIFNFIGLVYIEASIERLILFLYPTMVIFLSAVFLKKPVTTKQIVAISISYVGIFIAFADKLMVKNPATFWLGAALTFVSSFTYAIFLTVSDKLIKNVGSVRFTTTATLTMCVCLIAHALVAGKASVEGYNPHVYLYCILMAVLSTVIPVYLFNYSMSKLGATNISIISCLGPICTLVFSAIMLNETISMWQIAGTFVVMGGILFVHIDKKVKLPAWLTINK